jgi:hypothetical protein
MKLQALLALYASGDRDVATGGGGGGTVRQFWFMNSKY